MASPLVTQSIGWPAADYDLMARVQKLGATDITQATVSAIAYDVWPLSNPAQVQSSTLSKASVVFDTLQTDNDWPTDRYPDGYNFRWSVPGTLIPKEGETYRHRIKFTLTDNSVVWLVHDRQTKPWTER